MCYGGLSAEVCDGMALYLYGNSASQWKMCNDVQDRPRQGQFRFTFYGATVCNSLPSAVRDNTQQTVTNHVLAETKDSRSLSVTTSPLLVTASIRSAEPPSVLGAEIRRKYVNKTTKEKNP